MELRGEQVAARDGAGKAQAAIFGLARYVFGAGAAGVVAVNEVEPRLAAIRFFGPGGPALARRGQVAHAFPKRVPDA